jgi:serine protease AprX
MSVGAPADYQTAVQVQPMGERYKLRFPSLDALDAAIRSGIGLPVAATSRRRQFISLGSLKVDAGSLDARMRELEAEYAAEVVIDRQYAADETFPGVGLNSDVEEGDPYGPGLDDVLVAIGASEAWNESRGDGVLLAIVDTGVAPLLEFVRRGEGWAASGEEPWEDPHGHGTMVAAIAAASRAHGGAFDGVAPDATVFPCRTSFVDGELTVIYEVLTDLQREGKGPVVANNSFGLRSASPPLITKDDDFPDALQDAVDAGVIVCFSAGNYHHDAGGDPDSCAPTSIWAWKSRDDVLVTGAVDLDGEPWWYSSRGPGQYHGLPGCGPKPDISAPVPESGLVPRHDGARRVRHWGTSGASPQTAGLAALLQAQRERTIVEIAQRIRSSADALDHEASCVGSGRLNCLRAVSPSS